MAEVKTKKFNWKKALTIFFGVVVALRVLAYFVVSPVPKCDASRVTKRLESIVSADLAGNGYTTLTAKFTNIKETASDSKVRTCKADLVLVDMDTGETDSAERVYKISEDADGKTYSVRLN